MTDIVFFLFFSNGHIYIKDYRFKQQQFYKQQFLRYLNVETACKTCRFNLNSSSFCLFLGVSVLTFLPEQWLGGLCAVSSDHVVGLLYCKVSMSTLLHGLLGKAPDTYLIYQPFYISECLLSNLLDSLWVSLIRITSEFLKRRDWYNTPGCFSSATIMNLLDFVSVVILYL